MAIQRRGEETRAHILKAAEACFARRGYDATSVADICDLAGVSKGAFYHHFSSKQTLFLELLERWLVGMDALLESARVDANTVPDGLLQMASMVQPVFQEGRGRLPFFLEFWNKAARDPVVWQATIAPYRRYRDFFCKMIEAGIAEGTLRPVDPEATAQIIVSLAVGLVLQGVLDPGGADWGQMAHDGVRLLLNGLVQDL